MVKGMTFALDWRIAKTYGVNAAAVMGWIFENCQRAVKEAGADAGRGWVHVNQTALAQRLHLSRQTVAKILKKLIDDRLIQAANSYTDDEGIVHYREFYPATKGVRGRSEYCKLLSKESQRRFARVGQKRVARASQKPLAKCHRCYTISYDGFLVMELPPFEWRVRNHDTLLFWGANEAISSKLGVNCAVVFQYLWFWAHNWRFTPKQKDLGRLWRIYTAASLSRDIVFLSDDVILDALHTLEKEGLILSRRARWGVQWAIADEGYILMGQLPPVIQQEAGRTGMRALGAAVPKTSSAQDADAVAACVGSGSVVRVSHEGLIARGKAGGVELTRAALTAMKNTRHRLRRRALSAGASLRL